MKRYVLFIVIVLMTLVSGCGGKQAPTTGEARPFANVCDQVNKGKRVSVVGYLRLPQEFTGDMSVVLRLYENDSFAGKPIGVQTDIGSQANQMEAVPMQYSDDDLKVHLAGGQLAQLGTKVKVSGKVYFPLADVDFDCGLENPLIELAN
jgi:hypothetical protein